LLWFRSQWEGKVHKKKNVRQRFTRALEKRKNEKGKIPACWSAQKNRPGLEGEKRGLNVQVEKKGKKKRVSDP